MPVPVRPAYIIGVMLLNPLLGIDWSTVRLVALQERSVLVRCGEEPAMTFEFEDPEQMDAAFEEWLSSMPSSSAGFRDEASASLAVRSSLV